ncbi:hypothetical protein BGZ63DRAFT_400850 [Mariannaea sp. PMI_226]|nr:hypothetical protein BGZ63DRAFT_400850 [Mariannaea sp. PMI_226]
MVIVNDKQFTQLSSISERRDATKLGEPVGNARGLTLNVPFETQPIMRDSQYYDAREPASNQQLEECPSTKGLQVCLRMPQATHFKLLAQKGVRESTFYEISWLGPDRGKRATSRTEVSSERPGVQHVLWLASIRTGKRSGIVNGSDSQVVEK